MICQRVHHDATGLCRHHRVRLDKLSCPSLGAQSAKSTAQSHPALQNGLWHRCHVCRAGNSDWIQVGIVARKPGQKSVCQRTLAQLCFLKVCHGLPVSSNQVRVRRPRVHQSITLMIFGTMTPPWINGWELRIFIGIYRNTDSEAMIASLTNQCRLLATAASRICFKTIFPQSCAREMTQLQSVLDVTFNADFTGFSLPDTSIWAICLDMHQSPGTLVVMSPSVSLVLRSALQIFGSLPPSRKGHAMIAWAPKMSGSHKWSMINQWSINDHQWSTCRDDLDTKTATGSCLYIWASLLALFDVP